MAFPTDYTRLMEYELPVITGVHSNFVLLMKYDDFTSAALSSIDDGGGDLRFSSDSLGTNQLACEVVEFDKIGNNVVVWVKIPTASTAEVIHVWGGNVGDSQPLVTDTYGRNAVWSDYDYVLHLNDSSATDSTGNFTPTLSGSVSVASGAYFGNGLDFTGGGRIDIPSVSRTVDYQLQALTRLTSDPSANHWIVGTGGTSNTDYGLWSDNSDFSSGKPDIFSGTFRTGSGTSRLLSAENSAKGGNSYSVAIKNGSTTEGAMLLDGVEVDVVSNAGISSSTDTVYVGNSTGFGTSFNGVLQEIRARNTPLSDDHLATEHSNYSSVGAWGIPTDVGGGTTSVTKTVTFSWNDRERVTTPNQIVYDILENVDKNSTILWNTLEKTSKTYTFLYDMGEVVENSFTAKWNALERITTLGNIQWDDHELVTSVENIQWDVLGRITTFRNIQWDDREIVSSLKNVKWEVFEKVTSFKNFSWDNRELVSSLKNIQWDTLERITQNKGFLWDTLEAVSTTTKTATFEWGVLEKAAVIKSIDWDVLNLVSKSVDFDWNIFNKITKSLNIQWDDRERLQALKGIDWSVLERLEKSNIIEWDVREHITKSNQLSYSIFARVTKQYQFNWDSLAKIVRKTTTFDWDVRENMRRTIGFSWDILVKVVKSEEIAWDILNQVKSVGEFDYNISQRITNNLNIQWDGFEITSKAINIKWSVLTEEMPPISEKRLKVVLYENRTHKVAYENRMTVVDYEDRRHTVNK